MYEHEHEHEHKGKRVRSLNMVGWNGAKEVLLANVDIPNPYHRDISFNCCEGRERSGVKYLMYFPIDKVRYFKVSKRSVVATERVYDRLGLACHRGPPQVSLYLSTTMCRGLKISTNIFHTSQLLPPSLLQ